MELLSQKPNVIAVYRMLSDLIDQTPHQAEGELRKTIEQKGMFAGKVAIRQ